MLGYIWPATSHFADFAKLADKLDRAERSDRATMSADNASATNVDSQSDLLRAERTKSVADFFGGLLHEQRLIFPRNHQPELEFIDATRTRRAKSAAAIRLMRPTITRLTNEIDAVRAKRAQACKAWMLIRMGVKMGPGAPGFTSPAAVDAAIAQHTAEIDRLRLQLAPAVQLAEQKFHDFARMSACTDWLERVDGSEQWAEWLHRIELLKSTLHAIEPIYGHLAATRKSFYFGSVCVENYRSARNKAWAQKEFERFVEDEYKVTLAHIEQLSLAIPYPLKDGRGFLHLAGYFIAGNDQPGALGAFTYLRSIYERFAHLYREIVMELLEKLEAVEKGARLEIPRPVLTRRS
jgi:hypothetical protein